MQQPFRHHPPASVASGQRVSRCRQQAEGACLLRPCPPWAACWTRIIQSNDRSAGRITSGPPASAIRRPIFPNEPLQRPNCPTAHRPKYVRFVGLEDTCFVLKGCHTQRIAISLPKITILNRSQQAIQQDASAHVGVRDSVITHAPSCYPPFAASPLLCPSD